MFNQSDMKKITTTVLALLIVVSISAQLHFSFSHYTSDNGLSQNSITSIFKDSKGFLWFGTRDGLNRFDGYNFKNYNNNFNKKFSGISNRFLEIREDKNGFIWLKTYDEKVYRFNTQTEEFERLLNERGDEINEKIKRIFVLPSGDVWLLPYHTGCYKISVGEEEYQTVVKKYHTTLKNLPSNDVEKVFQDQYLTTWILTTNGIVLIDSKGKHTVKFAKIPFYSAVEDAKRIVLGSKNKLFQYDKRTQTFKLIDTPTSSKTLDIQSLNAGYYIINIENNGFLSYNPLKNEVKHFNVDNYPQLQSNTIQQIYTDRVGDVWLGVRATGVARFNVQNEQIEFIATTPTFERITNPNVFFVEDDKDMLWIQSYYGYFSWYDRKNNRLMPFKNLYNNDINTFLTYGVNHVLADEQGILWLSTNRGNGVFKCTFLPDYFKHILLDNKSVYNVSNETRAVFEDKQKRLWVATKDGMVHIYDQNRILLGVLDKSGYIRPNGKTDINVYNFFQDNVGDIWLSTKLKGLFRLKQKGANSFVVENFLHNNADAYSPSHNDFYSVTQDKSGRIWAGSYGGGLNLVQQIGNKTLFIHSNNGLKNYPIANCSKVRQVFVDSQNRMWVATTEGIVTFDANVKDPAKLNFIYYRNDKNAPTGISANDIHYIAEDAEKHIWMASFGGGLAMLKTTKITDNNFEFEKYSRASGLPNNIIYTITDDKQGYLWLTSENSIIKLNKLSKAIEVFGKGNEIENVEFSEATACLLQSGEICVGSKSGFYVFNPLEVKRRVIDAPIVFTGLKIMNKDVEIGEESTLKKQINSLNEIEFTHKQNVFSIEFATLDMRAPDKIQYSYLLEGFEKEWNNVGSKQSATYTSLHPGSYIFRVKSTDSEGVWLANERQIKIEVLPSFWQSIYAKILYFILLVGLFGLTLYVFLTIFKLKNNVQLEKQMTDMKLRFFTDISHELRTPLTLISLPVDNLLEEDIDPAIKMQLSHVRTNLDRVLMLINQILDFRKLQNNKMHLTIQEIDFGTFVSDCSRNFVEMAEAKSIQFKIEDASNGVKVWVDPERFDTIIYNLISNAIKFTPAGKSIVVKTEATPNTAVLSVIDEGIGIAQEKINFIFDRFFSISTIKSIAQKSTGIGLDLVKKMVDLHHATIHVDSQLDKGSTFKIEFKLGVTHFESDDVDVIVSDQKVPDDTNSDTTEVQIPVAVEIFENEKISPLILIVEDNDELRHFLKNSLKNHYRVAEAQNGLKGWKKVESLLPDIIIADLRMPEMDGMELTVKIREDKRTSHIPIILLTAVTDMESKVAGMKAGADDYITKPFNSAFLHARIENLMHQRKQLQLFYRAQIGSSKPDFSLPPLDVQSQDELFVEHLMLIMNENIENIDLNIDFLASKLNMSRTVFFNKLKSLTGYSPVEFVREIRFERAAQYIKDTNLTVSEISYRVGIDDPRYFSRCFKLKFGQTPSEYRIANKIE